MCGGSGPWASTTVVLSASTGSTIFSEDRVVTPLDTAITPPPIQMVDKQEKKLTVQTLYDRQLQWIVGNKRGREIIHIYVV